MADEVLFAGAHADTPLAAAPLAAVVRDRRPLDVARVAHGDRHVFFGDQVLDAELAFLGEDLRPAIVAVLLLHPAQFVDDDLHHQPVARENREEAFDQLQQLRQLVENLLPLQAGQPLELHVEDRLRLDLAQARTASSGRHALRPGSSRRESG